jgi:hypothetical protein
MRTLISALVGALAVSTLSIPSFAQSGAQLGLLDCVAEGSVGLVFGSTKDVNCTFTPANKDLPPETYSGSINKFGLDIGVTGATIMQWYVVASQADVYKPGSLEGNYIGTNAEASVAAGAGANLLVGGSGESFSLQPLSVQEQSGLNLALTVQNFELRADAL